MNSKKIILILVLLILLAGIGFYFYGLPPIKYWTKNPTNFEECKEATRGFFIIETLPAQCEFRGQTFEEKSLKIGSVENTDIQSPHSYPNGNPNEKRSLVWSYTLSHPGATSLRLHFDRFEIKYGRITALTVFEAVDYGPCEQSPEPESQTKQQPEEIFVGEQTIPKPCGLVQEKKEYTPQEIFDNNWINGDFLLVKDKERKVLEILQQSPFFLQNQYDFWSHTYSGVDTIILELYADSSDNDFGVSIDKYSRGFTEEERERVNQETTNQYLQDCERQGIPPEQCHIHIPE